MQLVQSAGQSTVHDFLDFSGTVTAGGAAQIVLPQHVSRSYLFFNNLSTGNLIIDFGPATATATLTSGVVTSIAAANAGTGYLIAPQVLLLGGVVTGDLATTPNLIGGRIAKATCVLSGSTIGAFTIQDGGAGYGVAPYVYLYNPINFQQPGANLGAGAKVPSATSGIVVLPNGQFVAESTVCPTSAMAVFGATTGQQFTCKVKVN